MIYIRVELWPLGLEDHPRKKVLGEARIWNTGTGTKTRGNYAAVIKGKKGKVMHETELNGFRRKALNTWDLVYQILKLVREK